jgi:hypothetical protein
MKKILLAISLLSCVALAQTTVNIPAIDTTPPTPGQCAVWVTSKKLGGQACIAAEGLATKADKTYVDSQDATKANDSAAVHKTGNESVAGVKTFSDAPVVSNTKLAPPPHVPTLAASAVTIADGGNKNPCWMSADRRTIFACGTDTLYTSIDDGATWATVKAGLTPYIKGIRQLANGELLVSTAANAGVAGSLWLSSGYPTTGAAATWTKVLDAAGGASSYFDGSWGMSCYGSICAVSEYGLGHTGDKSRYAYLSTDSGATWTQIFDIGTVEELHVHGIAYDPWWDALWLATGDVPVGKTLQVSFDHGSSWTVVSTAMQYVGIIPIENAILFTTDDAPNGVFRLSRTADRSLGAPVLAFQVSEALIQSDIGAMPFRAAGPGAPVLLPFIAKSGPGRIFATYDGYNFSTLWTDTVSYTLKGPQTIVGPTTNGKITGRLSDDRQANASRITFSGPPDNLSGKATSGANADITSLEFGNGSRWLIREAANVFTLRNGTGASPQTIRLYNTYTDSGNYERGMIGWSGDVFYVGTENDSPGTPRNLTIKANSLFFTTNSVQRWAVTSSGHLLTGLDNVNDVGAAAATRPRNIYAGTSVNVGNGAAIINAAGGTFTGYGSFGGGVTLGDLTGCDTTSDKLYLNASKKIVCGVDQAAAPGAGITSLGVSGSGQSGSTQTFASANDTNVTLTIGSAAETHTFTAGWTGTLAKARGGSGQDNSSVTFPASGTLTVTVASGTASLGTSSIAANTCTTVVTVAASGVATTDVVSFAPNADITGVTGYTPAGTLSIFPYPTANNVNFKVCNSDQTNAVTPGAVTLNWRVVR